MTLNDQFHRFLEEKSGKSKFQEAFNEMAKYVFGHCCLVANGKKYLLTEIEFYYYADAHKDEFCKKNGEQLKSDTLFFHYSGVDITFGKEKDKEKNEECGGILIRGIESVDKDVCENGPLRVLCTLLNKNNAEGVHVKLETSLPEKRECEIYQSLRIGLSVKAWDKDNIFRNAKYRYFIDGAKPTPKNVSSGEKVGYKK